MTTPIQSPVALKNVAAFMAMAMRLLERAPHLPGFGVCHGHSGLGKSYCSIFAVNRIRAIRIEVGDSWTRKTLLQHILRECGEPIEQRRTTIPELAERAKKALSDDLNRPLIIDEADKLVDKGMIEILREVAEATGIATIMVGEEMLPTKLYRVERMHNRVLDWLPAQPCDLDDTRVLARAMLPKIEIRDDLLQAIRDRSGGRARRIVVNLNTAAEIARNKSLKALDLKSWSGGFFTGDAPKFRNETNFNYGDKA